MNDECGLSKRKGASGYLLTVKQAKMATSANAGVADGIDSVGSLD